MILNGCKYAMNEIAFGVRDRFCTIVDMLVNASFSRFSQVAVSKTRGFRPENSCRKFQYRRQ